MVTVTCTLMLPLLAIATAVLIVPEQQLYGFPGRNTLLAVCFEIMRVRLGFVLQQAARKLRSCSCIRTTLPIGRHAHDTALICQFMPCDGMPAVPKHCRMMKPLLLWVCLVYVLVTAVQAFPSTTRPTHHLSGRALHQHDISINSASDAPVSSLPRHKPIRVNPRLAGVPVLATSPPEAAAPTPDAAFPLGRQKMRGFLCLPQRCLHQHLWPLWPSATASLGRVSRPAQPRTAPPCVGPDAPSTLVMPHIHCVPTSTMAAGMRASGVVVSLDTNVRKPAGVGQ